MSDTPRPRHAAPPPPPNWGLGHPDRDARLRTLLWPRVRQATRPNSLGTGGLRSWLLIGVLGVVVGALLFGGMARVLRPILLAPELGPILGPKALGVLTLMVVSLMLISGLVAAFTEFLLARDLELLRHTPMRIESFFGARLITVIVTSGWMSAALGVPLLGAFWSVLQGPWWTPLVGAVAGSALIVAVAAGAVMLAMAIAVVAPARRVRDTLSLIGLFVVAGGFFGLRAVRPEQLASPEGYRDLTMFLAAVQTPSSPFSPTEWATSAVWEALNGRLDLVPLGALVAFALAMVGAAGWTVTMAWDRAYTNALTGASRVGVRRAPRFNLDGWWERRLGVTRGAVVLKEWRLLVRDPAQWSHLALLALLLGVYLYNAAVLPTSELGLGRKILPLMMAAFNVVVAAFILAAVAGRFILPALTAELPMLWLYRSAPYGAGQLLRTKFACGVVPLVILALIMHIGTAHMLHLPLAVSIPAGVLLLTTTVASSALALAFGTRYPILHAEHPAQAATSGAGMAYTLLALGLICLALAGHLPLAKAWVTTPDVGGPWRHYLGGFAAAGFTYTALLAIAWYSVRWTTATMDHSADRSAIR